MVCALMAALLVGGLANLSEAHHARSAEKRACLYSLKLAREVNQRAPGINAAKRVTQDFLDSAAAARAKDYELSGSAHDRQVSLEWAAFAKELKRYANSKLLTEPSCT